MYDEVELQEWTQLFFYLWWVVQSTCHLIISIIWYMFFVLFRIHMS